MSTNLYIRFEKYLRRWGTRKAKLDPRKDKASMQLHKNKTEGQKPIVESTETNFVDFSGLGLVNDITPSTLKPNPLG